MDRNTKDELWDAIEEYGDAKQALGQIIEQGYYTEDEYTMFCQEVEEAAAKIRKIVRAD